MAPECVGDHLVSPPVNPHRSLRAVRQRRGLTQRTSSRRTAFRWSGCGRRCSGGSPRQLGDAAERAPAHGPLVELGEPALNGVEPRGARWSEVQLEPWMRLEPAVHFGRLVSAAVVEDQM